MTDEYFPWNLRLAISYWLSHKMTFYSSEMSGCFIEKCVFLPLSGANMAENKLIVFLFLQNIKDDI